MKIAGHILILVVLAMSASALAQDARRLERLSGQVESGLLEEGLSLAKLGMSLELSSKGESVRISIRGEKDTELATRIVDLDSDADAARAELTLIASELIRSELQQGATSSPEPAQEARDSSVSDAELANVLTVLKMPKFRTWQWRPSQAQDPWELRPWSIEYHVGVGAPLGLGGLSIERSFGRKFALGGGVGYSIEGPQYAAFARYKPLRVLAVGALGFSLGISRGNSVHPSPISSSDGDETRRDVTWLNGDLSFEARNGAFVVRFYLGGAQSLSVGSCVLEPTSTSEPDRPCEDTHILHPQGGMSFGYAL